MWVIFLLAAMSIAICLLGIAFIGNKVFIAMENDRRKNNQKNDEKEI